MRHVLYMLTACIVAVSLSLLWSAILPDSLAPTVSFLTGMACGVVGFTLASRKE